MTDHAIEDKSPKTSRPKVNSASQKELDKAEQEFDKFDENIKDLTMDRMNAAPKADSVQETKISNREAQKSDVYLKPKRSITAVDQKTGKAQVFNEKFRDEYNFQKEYVQFIFENKEIGGEAQSIWTRPFGGMPAEEWMVPQNKPLWGPRYLAEQIKRKFYHRLKMENQVVDMTGSTIAGAITVDTTIQRLDAHPVSQRKSVFMGANNFG